MNKERTCSGFMASHVRANGRTGDLSPAARQRGGLRGQLQVALTVSSDKRRCRECSCLPIGRIPRTFDTLGVLSAVSLIVRSALSVLPRFTEWTLQHHSAGGGNLTAAIGADIQEPVITVSWRTDMTHSGPICRDLRRASDYQFFKAAGSRLNVLCGPY